ncbi:S41 family peptidase [Neptunitalea lumnitzerae]|uniref:Tail specific protease domain-containing protein n=1 Tax=Neptunitalea lumnitzerae TaxID=2965509 RepID=A0ABQ5MI90_9FLAO|nr:S41 family peptidase [Neptunitalea sp. Y10]GLB49118.1 hypothetical protein Y10_14860 [Neptunitalea sp. Y10]
MKYTFSFIFLLLVLPLSSKTLSLNAISDSNILTYKKAGLIWGFLKYNHPTISSGKYNWDDEFVRLFATLKGADNDTDAETVLLNFVNQFDNKNIPDGEDVINSNYQWMSSYFTNSNLKNTIYRISQSKRKNDYYAKIDNLNYLSFSNEEPFKNFDVTEASHRLLLFFKFWNAIQYWDVNKEFVKHDWLSILDTYILDFLMANTSYEFELVKSRLIAELNDSHSSYFSKQVFDKDFKFKPSFGVVYVNDSLVVNYIYDKASCINNNVKIGDIITKINGESIKDGLQKRLAHLISASNFNFLTRFSYYLLCQETNKVSVTIVRNGLVVVQEINLLEDISYNDSYTIEGKHATIEKLGVNDFYVDLSKLSSKGCDSFFKAQKKLGIGNLILDLRRNNNLHLNTNKLCNYLITEEREFVKVIGPVKNNPLESDFVSGGGIASLVVSPFVVGKKSNSQLVSGKIVLLINRNTQSRGEYLALALQQANNCITVGNQTAGSPMNITTLVLPDGSSFNFTSFKALYPVSNKSVQQHGVKVDVVVDVKARNYSPDQYLEVAKEVINQ